MTKRAWPAPNYPIKKDMDTDLDILDPNRDDTIGELAAIDPPAPPVNRDVTVNWSWARTPEGARCIHITGPPAFTVTELEHLLPILAEVIAPIRDLRATKGFPD